MKKQWKLRKKRLKVSGFLPIRVHKMDIIRYNIDQMATCGTSIYKWRQADTSVTA